MEVASLNVTQIDMGPPPSPPSQDDSQEDEIIDFVLTYEEGKGDPDLREKFLESMKENGLEYYVQKPPHVASGSIIFIRIKIDFEKLKETAQEVFLRKTLVKPDDHEMKYKLMKGGDEQNQGPDKKKCYNFFKKIKDQFEVKPHSGLPLHDYNKFTLPFIMGNDQNRHQMKYISWNSEADFCSNAQRNYLVYYRLLSKCKVQISETVNDDDPPELNFYSFSDLLEKDVFTSAFPLHDPLMDHDEDDPVTNENERTYLKNEWANYKKWYKFQPLDNISHYFGEKIGFYFAWVGFYTHWLIILSIIGILVMLYGLCTIAFDFESKEICNESLRKFFYMCPLCDDTCDFWYYFSSCTSSRFSQLFDNSLTMLFAIVTTCWGILFLQCWQRKQSELQCRWDTYDFEDFEQHDRPEFIARMRKRVLELTNYKKFIRYNSALKRFELVQPLYYLWSKVLVGVSVVATMGFIAVLIVFSVFLYRTAVATALYRLLDKIPYGVDACDFAIFITGAGIQFVFILAIEQLNKFVTIKLTNWECHRTEAHYTSALTFKLFIFDFVNTYSSLFYLAFFKGNFIGHPGSYIRIGPLRLNECAAHGCMLELSIQLAIILIGKQIYYIISKLIKPYGCILWKIIIKQKGYTPLQQQSKKDYFHKRIYSPHYLSWQYLKFILQYGFVTLFAVSFPLAPLFALLNNIIELRIDAYQFIRVFRRPVSIRCQGIGLWMQFLYFITGLSVITNALLIATRSQFVDQLVYRYSYENEVTKTYCSNCTSDCSHGYVTWSTTAYPLTDLLIPISANSNDTRFPLYTVQKLIDYNSTSGMDGSNKLYLPFINFECLQEHGIINDTEFNIDSYSAAYNDPAFRKLVLDTDYKNGYIKHNFGPCFDETVTCRFRGQPVGSSVYWHIWAARVVFVVLFENLIFAVVGILSWMIPNVPGSVQREIRMEKQRLVKLAAS